MQEWIYVSEPYAIHDIIMPGFELVVFHMPFILAFAETLACAL